jgi:oxygen-independent coproporphyrinogen-3 oxidase
MNTELLDSGSPYVAYLYSYPHKTSYRALEPALDLGRLWSDADKRSLFLYLHIPFCEMRCGFCNLFTQSRPKEERVSRYLDALERQIHATRRWLGSASFSRFALGGGTPTYLEARDLERVFTLLARELGADVSRIPASVETSPETAEIERLEVLRRFGVSRVSIGVQSFDDREVKQLSRPQQSSRVDAALDRIRTLGFPTLNIDLMYGIPEQSTESWLDTIERALRFSPEELYLYPLYVRPLTGLGRRGAVSWDEQRLMHYRAGRALLLSRGYRQISMRMFRKESAPGEWGPIHRCQEDGMIGLGAGARSYTERVHYSTEYAVGARDVRDIIEAFNQRHDFELAHWGFVLDDEDRRRRWIILSLLADGIDLDAYRVYFGTEALTDMPELAELWDRGLAEKTERCIRLTERGIERSDTIGPWLHSSKVEALMRSHQPR